MASLAEMFETDTAAETEGVKVQYGTEWVLLARAGGSNKRFLKALEREMRPHRRAIANEVMDNEIAQEVLKEVYAETIVLAWGGKNGDGIIEFRPGQPLTFSKENVLKAFAELPAFFQDTMENAGKYTNFRAMVQEADSGN